MQYKYRFFNYFALEMLDVDVGREARISTEMLRSTTFKWDPLMSLFEFPSKTTISSAITPRGGPEPFSRFETTTSSLDDRQHTFQ